MAKPKRERIDKGITNKLPQKVKAKRPEDMSRTELRALRRAGSSELRNLPIYIPPDRAVWRELIRRKLCRNRAGQIELGLGEIDIAESVAREIVAAGDAQPHLTYSPRQIKLWNVTPEMIAEAREILKLIYAYRKENFRR